MFKLKISYVYIIVIFLFFITYTGKVFASSVLTTNTPSLITQTSVSLNGSIVDVGRHSPTVRGFEWGISTSYGNTTSDTNFYILNSVNDAVNYATQIDIDSSGNIYVASGNEGSVKKFDSNLNLLMTISGFSYPTGVAIDSVGNIFIYDAEHVYKYNSLGVLQSQFGSTGTGNGQFLFGEATLAIDSNDNIYVSDVGNDRIQKFNSAGTFITKWGSSGSGNSQFGYARDIEIDSNDYIYIVDQDLNRVQKFDSNGTFITKWGSYGTGNGEFDQSMFVAVDSHNNVYVGDEFNNRIQKFDSNGNYISQFGEIGTLVDPYGGLVFNSSNIIYYIDEYTNLKKLTDPNGSFSAVINDLNCGATYHYRFYTTTNSGTTYGSDSEFSTSSCPQSISTSASSRVNNLVNMGKIEEAKRFIQEFPNSINTITNPEIKKFILPSQETINQELKSIRLRSTERKGNKNLLVKEIQAKLRIKVDGIFGPITEKSVKKLQNDRNIKVDGIVGPQTWDELDKTE